MTMMDIDEAAEYMNYTPGYVRQLIREDKLDTTLVPITEGSSVRKHKVSAQECDRYKDSVSTRTRRTDGRNKYLLYATIPEIHDAVAALERAGLEEVADQIRPANDIKGVPEWLQERMD